MRVTEQIDALDIMGVNSANHLILPKIIASLLSFPFLISISMMVGMGGGYAAATIWNIVSSNDFIEGLNFYFVPFEIVYALIKSVVFAFIIVSVASFYGYYAKGGAEDVGRASTKAVVVSSIAILVTNLILTKLILG